MSLPNGMQWEVEFPYTMNWDGRPYRLRTRMVVKRGGRVYVVYQRGGIYISDRGKGFCLVGGGNRYEVVNRHHAELIIRAIEAPETLTVIVQVEPDMSFIGEWDNEPEAME